MGASVETALGRVAQWRDKWPRIADDAPRDAAGQRPQYSFFYPQEEYRRDLLDGIAEMVRLGVGDVEVHLHHDNEQRDAFIRKVTEYCRRLTDDHGLLRQQDGRTVFGFIHGNWALDNSRPDGKCVRPQRRNRPAARSGLLRRFHHAVSSLGDPGARCEPDLLVHKQSRQSSQVLRSRDRSHSWRRQARRPADDHRTARAALWRTAAAARWRPERLPDTICRRPRGCGRWFDLAPTIGDDLFLKLYTHGAQERNLEPLLNGGLGNLFRWLAEEAERRGIEIHWATAWQMYQAADALIHGREAIQAAAAGVTGASQ